MTAGSAVLAVNSATPGFSGYRLALGVASSHMVISEPVPDVIEEIGWREIRKYLAAGDGSRSSDIAKTGGTGMFAGSEEIGLSHFTCGLEFAIPVTAASGLGEGIEATFRAVNDGERDIDASFDELSGNESDGLILCA